MFRVLRMIHLIDVVHPCLSGSTYHGQSKTNVMAVTHHLNVIGTVLRGLERMSARILAHALFGALERSGRPHLILRQNNLLIRPGFEAEDTGERIFHDRLSRGRIAIPAG